jgi:hypothetical protein
MMAYRLHGDKTHLSALNGSGHLQVPAAFIMKTKSLYPSNKGPSALKSCSQLGSEENNRTPIPGLAGYTSQIKLLTK